MERRRGTGAEETVVVSEEEEGLRAVRWHPGTQQQRSPPPTAAATAEELPPTTSIHTSALPNNPRRGIPLLKTLLLPRTPLHYTTLPPGELQAHRCSLGLEPSGPSRLSRAQSLPAEEEEETTATTPPPFLPLPA